MAYERIEAGFVKINDELHWCGIRVLSQKEAEDNNEGFPFYEEDLIKIINDKTRLPRGVNPHNIKILAKNILNLKNSGFMMSNCNKTTEHTPISAEDLIDNGAEVRDASGAPTGFHKGDIVAYTEELKRNNPLKRIAILNPANKTVMGGGAFVGAPALEEIYFRSSDMVLAYIKHAWDVGEKNQDDGFTYIAYQHSARPTYNIPMQPKTSWVTEVNFSHKPPIVKGQGYTALKDPFSAFVIGSTAPDYGSVAEARKDSNNEKIIKDEIRAQLSSAIENQIDILVLTAFGCGAFNNDPQKVARYYWEVLYEENYAQFFEKIDFAIWQDPDPTMSQNFEVFKKVFDKLNQQKFLENNKTAIDLGIVIGGILGAAGTGAGIGALMGTFVAPGIGTAAGAFLGGLFGAGFGIIAVGLQGLIRGRLVGGINKIAESLGSSALTVLGSAGIGALIGTFMLPGVGSAIGAAVGAAAGLLIAVILAPFPTPDSKSVAPAKKKKIKGSTAGMFEEMKPGPRNEKRKEMDVDESASFQSLHKKKETSKTTKGADEDPKPSFYESLR